MAQTNRAVGSVGRSGVRVAAAHRATAEVVVWVLGFAEQVDVERGLSDHDYLRS
jgi:hypothetical protein